MFALVGLPQDFIRKTDIKKLGEELAREWAQAGVLDKAEDLKRVYANPNKTTLFARVNRVASSHLEDKTATVGKYRVSLRIKSDITVCCYRCGGRFHIAESCRKNKEDRCFHCGSRTCEHRNRSHNCKAPAFCIVCEKAGHDVWNLQKCLLLNKLGLVIICFLYIH